MVYKKTVTGATNYLKLFGYEFSFKDGDSIHLKKTEAKSVEPGTNSRPGYIETSEKTSRILYAGENANGNDDYRIFYGKSEKKGMTVIGCDMENDLVPHVHGCVVYQKGDTAAVEIRGLRFKGNSVTVILEQAPGCMNPTIWMMPNKSQGEASTKEKNKKERNNE